MELNQRMLWPWRAVSKPRFLGSVRVAVEIASQLLTRAMLF